MTAGEPGRTRPAGGVDLQVHGRGVLVLVLRAARKPPALGGFGGAHDPDQQALGFVHGPAVLDHGALGELVTGGVHIRLQRERGTGTGP